MGTSQGRWDTPAPRADVYLTAFDTFCTALNRGGPFPTPVLVTGKISEMRAALLLGANDFQPKPFCYEQLLLRAAKIRRKCRVLSFAKGYLLWEPGKLWGEGGFVELSSQEESILRKFRNSADNNFIEPWIQNKRTADALISGLRQKISRALGSASSGVNPIQSVRGNGWLLNVLH